MEEVSGDVPDTVKGLYSQISDANAGKQSASRRLNLREALLKFLEKAAK